MINLSRISICLLLGLSFLSCEDTHKEHPVFKYFPPSNVMEKGFVNKYYRHVIPKNPDATTRTEITYSKFIQTDADRIRMERYNAGFELVGIVEKYISGDTIFNESAIEIWRTDTTKLEIINSMVSTWLSSTGSPYQFHFESNGKQYQYNEVQTDLFDSVVINRAAKVFINKSWYKEETTDSLLNERTDTTYYVADLGFFAATGENAEYFFKTELMEQMPLSKFEELADHNRKRIAYIDPKKTLTNDEGFELCGHEKFIADYYNGRPHAGYLYGKGEMTKIIFEALEPGKLIGQNGMLTFRFVVNCSGEAGRFITEEFDFDYQRKEFSKEAINHLLDILVKLNNWQQLEIDGEPRDAYVYITFKIENGEIIDILP